jgi:hypothetical protein
MVPQRVQLRPDRLHRRQFLVGVPLLGEQLAAHLGGGQPRVQARRAEGGIGLTLPIDDGRDVRQQPGEPRLRPLAAPQGAGVDDGDPARQRARPLADRPPVPAAFALGPPLPARPQRARRPRHEHPTGAAGERPGGRAEQRLMPLGQFHDPSPARDTTASTQYRQWGDHFYANP